MILLHGGYTWLIDRVVLGRPTIELRVDPRMNHPTGTPCRPLFSLRLLFIVLTRR